MRARDRISRTSPATLVIPGQGQIPHFCLRKPASGVCFSHRESFDLRFDICLRDIKTSTSLRSLGPQFQLCGKPKSDRPLRELPFGLQLQEIRPLVSHCREFPRSPENQPILLVAAAGTSARLRVAHSEIETRPLRSGPSARDLSGILSNDP